MLMKKIHVFFTAMVLLALSLSAAAQNITVRGTVKDAAGEGIVGANIILKGNRTVYTMTDIAGAFSLNVPANGVLEVLCMGYQGQDVPVSGRTNIDIVLQDDSQILDETIVVAYGTATKSSFTGSAAVVDNETIAKKLTTSVTNALSGASAGVQVISSTGDPTSSSPTIRIRGVGSMSASNSPLIVVDGVPYEGSISDINPQDVESMSVLKDASASAIYGHRGANGVILITTKRAQAGDAIVKFDARVGSSSRLIPNYDVITDPGQYYETYYKYMYNNYYYTGHSVAQSYAYADQNLYNQSNGGLGYKVYTLPQGEKLVGNNFRLNPNATLGYSDGEYYYLPDDWYNEVFHNAMRQEYNISAAGASDRFNYYASVGYLDQGGIVVNSGYKRYTARLNADYQIKKWIKVTSNMSYSYSDMGNVSSGSWGSSGNAFYYANTIAPIYPLYVRKLDENGKPYIVEESGRIKYDANSMNFVRASFTGNPVRDLYNDIKKGYADVLVGKWGLVLTPFKGLTLNANLGLTDDNTRYNYLYSTFGSGSSSDGGVDVEHSRMFTTNQQYLAEYKFDLSEVNHFDFLAGYEQYNRKSQVLEGYNDHLFNPFIGELNNADGSDSKSVSSYTNYYMTEGFLARAQYDYDGTVFASASFRRDASSRFAKGHRWGNFGSFGVAWLVSKAPWFNVPGVDMLKLKASYGIQGNDGLGSYYPYSDQYSHKYDGTSYSSSLSYKGNEDLTWETSYSFNIGVDFELLNRYLNGTIEFFNRDTKDLLYNKSVPYSAGNPTGTVSTNVGSIRNRGIELTLDGDIMRRRNFNWSWNFNITSYKNTILALDQDKEEEGIKGSYYIYKVGGSLYDAYMYKWAGVDQETGEALYYKKTFDDDGKWTGEETTVRDFALLTTNDRYELGSILPKAYGGFGTTLSFYGFDFSVQCAYQLGGKYYDGNYQLLMGTNKFAGQALHKDLLNSWTPTNTNTDVPRTDLEEAIGQSAVDRFFVSSNYLSVNNVTLGYTFPAAWTKKINLNALRVYFAGDNLAVLVARQGIDPRNSMGLNSVTTASGNSSYAPMRTITAGVTLTF